MSSLEDRCWSCSCASKVEAKHSSAANGLARTAAEMMPVVSSALRSAYGSLRGVRAANLLRRGLVLFAVGASLALVLNLLQIQRKVTLFPEEVMATLFSSAWWIPPCCGTGAGEETRRRGVAAYNSRKELFPFTVVAAREPAQGWEHWDAWLKALAYILHHIHDLISCAT